MDKSYEIFTNEELHLLEQEFDKPTDERNCKPNARYSYEEVSPDDDPADTLDMFAKTLNAEARYYPKYWQ